jgi:Glu-tRNA(Gln) amidotransferase subunit E-like FAD-binding protein
LAKKDITVTIGVEWDVDLIWTDRKLFCNCPASTTLTYKEIKWSRQLESEQNCLIIDNPWFEGDNITSKKYFWQDDAICTYELGQLPPIVLDREALQIAIRVLMCIGGKASDVIYVMRESVFDGSFYSGWRRSCWIGNGGEIPVGGSTVSVSRVLLSERGAMKVDDAKQSEFWDLGYCGRASLQITIDPAYRSVDETVEIASRLRDLTLSDHWTVANTGRWSLICVRGGYAPLKIRGITNVGRFATLLERVKRDIIWTNSSIIRREVGFEDHYAHIAIRQTQLVSQELELCGEEKAYFQVLESATELDPELPPIHITAPQVEHWRQHLPLTAWQFRAQLRLAGISHQIVEWFIKEGKAHLYMQIHLANPNIKPQLLVELVRNWYICLQRRGIPVHQVTSERYLAIAALYVISQCSREALRDLLALTALYPHISVRHLASGKMRIKPIPVSRLRQQLPKFIAGDLPRKTDWLAREKFWMGRLMSHLRGAIKGATIRRELYRYFSQNPPTEFDRCVFPPPTKGAIPKR